MHAEVYWQDCLAGHLCDLKIDQPYYRGTWKPAWDPGFEHAFREMQVRIAPDGLGILPVTLRSTDGKLSTPAAAMVRPLPEREPYFRFASEDVQAGIVREPSRPPSTRACERCGQPISAHRLDLLPSAAKCWECQTLTERADGNENTRTRGETERD
jgi:hypothetical protein